MSKSPPGVIKVTIGEHAFRFEVQSELGSRSNGLCLGYEATAESRIEITRTFGDFQIIIIIFGNSGFAHMYAGSPLRHVGTVWDISDETSRSQEDMLLGLVGKRWLVNAACADERIKALHKSAMRVDFWVEPQEERPWKRRKFTDAELVCGNESFEVHRGLLAAKSEVFEAAFESAFQEGVKAKYEIKDVSKDAVKGALAKRLKRWRDSPFFVLCFVSLLVFLFCFRNEWWLLPQKIQPRNAVLSLHWKPFCGKRWNPSRHIELGNAIRTLRFGR